VFRQSNEAFWEMKTPLYRAQPELGDARRASSSPHLRAGHRRGELDACLGDPSSLQAVRDDAALATRLGVRSTPTVIVDGVPVSSPSASAVRAALDAALRD
jgi:protein-disulfide isomerase